jgi:Ca2+-binding EF-hand superfamily protein
VDINDNSGIIAPAEKENTITDQRNPLVRELYHHSSDNTASQENANEQKDEIAINTASAQQQLRSIFLFHRPELFFRAIEIGIMFACLFMALWVTNMITIVKDIHQESEAYTFVAEIVIILPIVLHFKTLPYITETCALVDAISDLNLLAANRVLEDTLETHRLMKRVRKKVLSHAAEALQIQQSWLRADGHKIDAEIAAQKHNLEGLVSKLLGYDRTIDRVQRAIAYHSYLVHRLKERWSKLNLQDSRDNTILGVQKQLQKELHFENRKLQKLAQKLPHLQTNRSDTWKEFEMMKSIVDNQDLGNRKRFIDELFEELDQDGSGAIDKVEFREILHQLSITLSDHKFRLLFRAIDSRNGDGKIQRDELLDFLFPPMSREIIDYRHFHLDKALQSQLLHKTTTGHRTVAPPVLRTQSQHQKNHRGCYQTEEIVSSDSD